MTETEVKPKPKRPAKPKRARLKRGPGRRLSTADWLEAEELYRNGWTQAQLADKLDVRTETISRHMTQHKVKGGERAEAVRKELADALLRKQREFAEQKAQRQIDSKEMLYKMVNILMGAYAKEFQLALSSGKGLQALQSSARALKDSLLSLKIGREELYALLDVKESGDGGELPSLEVSSLTKQEEEALRSRLEPDADGNEDDDERLAADIAEVVDRIDHQVEATQASE